MLPTEDSRPFRIAVQLSVILAILAAASLEDDGWTRGLVAIGLSLVGAWISWHRRGAKNGWIKLGLAIGMMAAFWRFLGEAMYNPYDTRLSLAHLLIELQVLHSFDLPRRKDLYYSMVVSMALISVAATVSRTMGFGAWFVPWTVVILISAGLGHLARFREAEAPRLWPLIRPFVVPIPLMALVAVGIWMALPRYDGLRLQSLPMSVRLPTPPGFTGQINNPAYPSPAQLSGQAGLMRGGKLPFNPNAYYGFSYNLDLNYRGKLDDAIVMRVRSRIPTYWRGMAFDHFDGGSWSMTQPDKTQRYSGYSPPIVVHPALADGHNELTARRELIQTFYIEQDQSNLIFAAQEVESLFFPTTYLLEDRYGGLRSPVQLSKGMVYSVVSQIPRYDPMFLRRARPVITTGLNWRTYMDVPQQLPDRVRGLATQVTAGSTNAYDRMDKLSHYLSTQYRYNLDIPTVKPGHDAIDEFLFVQKEGYCEQFATALAVMGRTVGVPTRLVTGYTPGTLNRLTGYWEVRGSDAHGWVEAYFPAFGWVPFDPSPGFVATLNPDVPLDPLQRLGRRLAGWLMGFGDLALPVGGLHVWAVVAYLGMGISAVVAALLLWRQRPRRRTPQWADRLDQLYWRARLQARRQGTSDSDGTTPRTFADRVAAQRPETADAWAKLTDLFERRHYSPDPIGADDVDRAKALLRQLAGR
ncbi:MAG: DUF3488 domain-containing protein [Candidatus Sericytochromatia bacterium]|nr:DUF3488 domain-containing protein [Candidatus Sericytochromatia bacterium]